MTIPIAVNISFCLSGLILGAVCMYFCDPERGERRRAMLRARIIAQLDYFNGNIDASLYGMQQRMRGLASRVRRRHDP